MKALKLVIGKNSFIHFKNMEDGTFCHKDKERNFYLTAGGETFNFFLQLAR